MVQDEQWQVRSYCVRMLGGNMRVLSKREIRNELFQINNFVTRLLVENVDEETGEIENEKVFGFLQDADVKRADLLSTAVISLKHYRDLVQHVANKIKQLNDIKRS